MTDPATAAPPERSILLPVLIALVVASVLMLITAAGGASHPVPSDGAEAAGYLAGTILGRILLFGFAPFLILLFTALRGRRGGQIVAALVILIGWATLLSAGTTLLFARMGNQAALRAEVARFHTEVERQGAQFTARYHAIAPALTIRPGSAGPDRRFVGARTAIAQARQILADQRATLTQIGVDERRRLAAISEDEARGFDRGFATSRASTEHLLTLVSANLDELSATLDFFDRTRDRWSIDGDTWRFRSQEDLDEFNRHGERLRQQGEEIHTAQAELSAIAGRSRTEMSRFESTGQR